MLAEYKGLAIVFSFLLLALTAHFVKWLLATPKPAAAPAQSVYVEVVPQNKNPPRAR